MGFQDAVKTCFGKYATFSGRASRSEFWWFMLFIFILNIVLGTAENMMSTPEEEMGGSFGLFTAIFSLAILLPALSVNVRRLHDLGKSGWWYLLVLIPVLGALVLLFFYVQRGTVGSNDFGPDPLG